MAGSWRPRCPHTPLRALPGVHSHYLPQFGCQLQSSIDRGPATNRRLRARWSLAPVWSLFAHKEGQSILIGAMLRGMYSLFLFSRLYKRCKVLPQAVQLARDALSSTGVSLRLQRPSPLHQHTIFAARNCSFPDRNLRSSTDWPLLTSSASCGEMEATLRYHQQQIEEQASCGAP
eukprot:3864126-Rhodomonas_salina.2